MTKVDMVAKFLGSANVCINGTVFIVQSQHKSEGDINNKAFRAMRYNQVNCLTGNVSYDAGLSKLVNTGSVEPMILKRK